MIRLLFLITLLLLGTHPLKAEDKDVSMSDGDFVQALDSTKSPFEDGLPKPVVVAPPAPKPVVKPVEPVVVKPVIRPKPSPPPIAPPALKLQGVIVGEGSDQSAIINGEIVPVQGLIQGARLLAVTNQGAELVFKGKKIFLKVD